MSTLIKKYSKRHTELSCSMATSDKYMPHHMCIQGLKYILNIINTLIFIWCRFTGEEYSWASELHPLSKASL